MHTADDLDDLSRQALRIGFDAIAGYVGGGFEAWRRSGRPVEVGRAYDVDALARDLAPGGAEAPFVIDVRQSAEFEAGHVPGAIHIGVGELPERLDALPRDRAIATVCASGYRSSVAASLLRARGFDRVNAVRGGLPDWEARGFPSPTAALRMLARGPSWLRAARVTRTRRCGSAPRSAHPDPQRAERGDPEQDRVEHHDDRDGGRQHVPDGPFRGSPSAAGRSRAGP